MLNRLRYANERYKFIFDFVDLLQRQCHKINSNSDGLRVDSPNWKKNKKATIIPKNNDDKYFQYAVTVALNYEEIRKNSESISHINRFINKYNWTGINYPSGKDDWKIFEKNNPTITLNVLYAKKEKGVLPKFQNMTQSVKNKFQIKKAGIVIQ